MRRWYERWAWRGGCEVKKQEIRVRHWNRLTDEQEDGTVIKEEEIYYLVVPDYDVSVKMHWKKRDCDVINGEGVGCSKP